MNGIGQHELRAARELAVGADPSAANRSSAQPPGLRSGRASVHSEVFNLKRIGYPTQTATGRLF